MSDAAVDPLERLLAAEVLAVDALTAQITSVFEARGIDSIVLKGPAVAKWLYEGRPVRAYGDSDLLVSPDHWDWAQAILRELGFEDALGPLAHPRMESITSYSWVRGRQNVDLHCSIWGLGA